MIGNIRLAALSRWRNKWRHERGSALVELLGVALVFIVPMVYFVITLAQVQNGAFAASRIAADAARIMANSGSHEIGYRRANLVTARTLQSYRINADAASVLRFDCATDNCVNRGGGVNATATIKVTLPLLPSFVSDVIALEIPISATRTQFVGPYSD